MSLKNMKCLEEYNSVTLPVTEAGLTIITKKNNTRVYSRRQNMLGLDKRR